MKHENCNLFCVLCSVFVCYQIHSLLYYLWSINSVLCLFTYFRSSTMTLENSNFSLTPQMQSWVCPSVSSDKIKSVRKRDRESEKERQREWLSNGEWFSKWNVYEVFLEHEKLKMDNRAISPMGMPKVKPKCPDIYGKLVHCNGSYSAT